MAYIVDSQIFFAYPAAINVSMKDCMPKITYEAAVAGVEGRLNRTDAGRYLGLTSKALAEYKRLGKGPPLHKIGGMCFYYVADLRTYVREQVDN